MPMGQPMPEGQPAPEQAQGQPGGAAQLVAGIHTDMMKLQELVGSKMPEEAQALGQIISAYQQFAEGLGQPSGAPKQGPAGPATTTPEAGAANVQPV